MDAVDQIRGADVVYACAGNHPNRAAGDLENFNPGEVGRGKTNKYQTNQPQGDRQNSTLAGRSKCATVAVKIAQRTR